MPGIDFYFGWPYGWRWLFAGAGALAVLAGTWWRLTVRDVSRQRAAVLASLRAAALLLIILYLLEPYMRVFKAGQRTPRVDVWVDASKSMAFPAAPSGKGSRYKTALRTAHDMVAAFSERGIQAQLAAFAAAAIPQPPRTDAELAPGPTDIAAPLAAAFGATAAVIISDGRHNAAADAVREAERLRTKGTAVFAVPVGQGLFNVAVRDVKLKRGGGLATTLDLEAVVEVRTGGAQPSPNETVGGNNVLRLLDEDGRTLKECPVSLEPGIRSYAMRVEATTPGLRKFRLELPVFESEVTAADNSAPFSVLVTKRPLRVLYMEGSEYRRQDRQLWEHQYLEQALEEDPDIDVTVLLRDEIPEAHALAVSWVKNEKRGYPRTRKELFKYDVIVSSDIDIDYFSDEQLSWTVEFVAERGGGFAMVGGWTAFGPGGYDGSVMDKMLPVDMLGRFEHYVENEEFRWKLAPDALLHPIMRIDPDAERNRLAWDLMPPFYGHNRVERAKPAAVPLAYHPTDRNLYGQCVILAVQEFGRGRTMALTTDTTAGWGRSFEDEWGEDGDNRYFRRFWRNAVKWLAAWRIHTPQQHILMTTDRAFYRTGQTVRVDIEVRDDEFRLGGAVKDLRLEAAYASGKTVPVPVERLADGACRAAFTALEPGELALTGAVVLNDGETHEDKLALPVKQEDIESIDCVVDSQLLERLAGPGRVLPPERSDELVARVAALPEMAVSFRDLELMHSWLVLALALGLLFTEWALRKRWGLP